MTTFGPNAVLPHGTEARRRTHWAHGELCVVCEPDVEWMTHCVVCREKVAVVGGIVIEHGPDVAVVCPGSGDRLPFLPKRAAPPVRGAA